VNIIEPGGKSPSEPESHPRRCSRRCSWKLPLIAIGTLGAATLLARRSGYKLGLNTVVRCRQGHLFTTIWIPGVKFKGLDLGIARIQRCPVGAHWSLVTPVKESSLSGAELEAARAQRDVRIP
jgi:hypothetical protein